MVGKTTAVDSYLFFLESPIETNDGRKKLRDNFFGTLSG